MLPSRGSNMNDCIGYNRETSSIVSLEESSEHCGCHNDGAVVIMIRAMTAYMGVATIYLRGDTSPPPLKKSRLDPPPTFAIKNILHDLSTSHTMTLI